RPIWHPRCPWPSVSRSWQARRGRAPDREGVAPRAGRRQGFDTAALTPRRTAPKEGARRGQVGPGRRVLAAGAWRSQVAHSLGVRVVGRSNRLAPTPLADGGAGFRPARGLRRRHLGGTLPAVAWRRRRSSWFATMTVCTRKGSRRSPPRCVGSVRWWWWRPTVSAARWAIRSP